MAKFVMPHFPNFVLMFLDSPVFSFYPKTLIGITNKSNLLDSSVQDVIPSTELTLTSI